MNFKDLRIYFSFYEVKFSANNFKESKLSNGVYFYRLTTSNGFSEVKMIFIR